MLRRLLLPLLALLVLAAWAPAARAAIVDDAAESLRSDPFYVHPDVESEFEPGEIAELRERIRNSSAGPMWVAVLPQRAIEEENGQLGSVAGKLASTVGERGIHAVLVPSDAVLFRAASNALGGDPRINEAALRASQTHVDDNAGPVLSDFLDRVDDLGAPEPAATAGPAESEGGGGIGVGAIILLAFGALAAGAVLLTGRERRRLQDRAFAEAKEDARDDLVALGDEIRALDAEVEMPHAPHAAIDDYAVAVAAYQRAERAWKAATMPQELEPVSMALEEGRWAMASARARLAGDEPPVRRPPCFFDPRHGPSSRDVEWAPPYGAARMVPACEEDAERIERGEEPHAREVMVGGQRLPYWNAGPAYAPFAGGFFGGAGASLLPSLLVGSMLGMSIGTTLGADAALGGEAADLGGGDFGGDFGGGADAGGGFGGGNF